MGHNINFSIRKFKNDVSELSGESLKFCCVYLCLQYFWQDAAADYFDDVHGFANHE